jgi:hypothetical protein
MTQRRQRKRQRKQPVVKILTGLKEALARDKRRKPPAEELALARRVDERWDQIARIAPGLSKGNVRGHAKLLAIWEPFIRPRQPHLLLRGKREQLEKLRTAMHRTIAAIKALERKEPFAIVDLGLDNLRKPLEFYRDVIERALPDVPPGRSGGSPRARIEREIKDMAAQMSHRLLREVGIAPDRSLRGPWIELTEILVEIVLDRRDIGDVSRACAAYEKEYERMIKDPLAYYGFKRKEQRGDS